MKVIVHNKPDFKERFVRLFCCSIKTKKNPKWWVYHNCEYFIERNVFHDKKTYLLTVEIETLYEATHDVPNCEDCEYAQVEDCYCETSRMMMEDRD